MRNKYFLLLLFISLTVSLALFACSGEEEEEPPHEHTLTYRVADTSRGYLLGENVQVLFPDQKSLPVTAAAKSCYVFSGWSDGYPEANRYGDMIDEDTELVAYFQYDHASLPVVYIFTESDIRSKETYIPARIGTDCCDEEFIFEDCDAQIRGRGNASWGFEKKSYKIKFSKKRDPFGLNPEASEKDWILIGNGCDKSLMRNYVAFSLGKAFDGIDYSSACTQVELYLNETYQGVYLLCEQTEVNPGRIDIDDSLETDDNGFLLELDAYAGGIRDLDYFTISRYNIMFSVKSKVASREQVRHIKSFMTEAFEAMTDGDRDRIDQLVDLDSMTDMLILQEFMKNIDCGWSSFFLSVPENGGKLYFLAPWDFDLSSGNDMRLGNGGYSNIYAATGRNGFSQSNRLFMAMWKHDWFKQLVCERWNELKSTITDTVNDCRQYAVDHTDCGDRNFEKWSSLWEYRVNQEPYEVLKLKSYSEQVDYLFEWLSNRYDWLDEYYNELLSELTSEELPEKQQ